MQVSPFKLELEAFFKVLPKDWLLAILDHQYYL